MRYSFEVFAGIAGLVSAVGIVTWRGSHGRTNAVVQQAEISNLQHDGNHGKLGTARGSETRRGKPLVRVTKCRCFV